jgi:methylase of polypeptide subunit release factors
MQAYVFANHDLEVLGIDLNYDWIDAARAAADELGAKNLEFLAEDITEEIRDLAEGAT